MAFDEPASKRIFNCEFCGNDYRASPPDDIYIIARIKQCSVCDVLLLNKYVKRVHECDNCHKRNTLYWHDKTEHDPLEISRARQKSSSISYLMRNRF